MLWCLDDFVDFSIDLDCRRIYVVDLDVRFFNESQHFGVSLKRCFQVAVVVAQKTQFGFKLNRVNNLFKRIFQKLTLRFRVGNSQKYWQNLFEAVLDQQLPLRGFL